MEREHYYTREIAHNREEYLSGHGESPGVFHRGSARALGLGGECSAEAFQRLLSHPVAPPSKGMRRRSNMVI